MGERAGLNGDVRTAWVQGKGRERKGKEGRGREGKGKEGKGWERKGKEGKGWERKGQEGKGRERMGKEGKRKGKGRDRMGKEGKGRERKGKEGKRKGKEGKGSERKGKEGKGRERKGKKGKGWESKGKEGKGWERKEKGRERKGKEGKGAGAMEWPEMDGEKKPLVMSELGCADGCGREMGAENCVDGCGRRGCKGVAGNGWGEEAAGDERAWLRGRLRTANGVRRIARTAADGVGARDGCGRQMGAENCEDCCGRRGCKGVAGNAWVGRRSRW